MNKAESVDGKEELYNKVNRIYSSLENVNIIKLINSKEDIFKDKEQAIEMLEYINLIFFDKITSNSNYIKCMKIVEDTKDRLKKNNNYDMTIDNLNMTVWEVINGKYYRS